VSVAAPANVTIDPSRDGAPNRSPGAENVTGPPGTPTDNNEPADRPNRTGRGNPAATNGSATVPDPDTSADNGTHRSPSRPAPSRRNTGPSYATIVNEPSGFTNVSDDAEPSPSTFTRAPCRRAANPADTRSGRSDTTGGAG
jgi:hypothetical protein